MFRSQDVTFESRQSCLGKSSLIRIDAYIMFFFDPDVLNRFIGLNPV